MKIDEAIQEIRAVRHEISAEHGHDTRALVEYYRKLDQQDHARVLKPRHRRLATEAPPRRLKDDPTATGS